MSEFEKEMTGLVEQNFIEKKGSFVICRCDPFPMIFVHVPLSIIMFGFRSGTQAIVNGDGSSNETKRRWFTFL